MLHPFSLEHFTTAGPPPKEGNVPAYWFAFCDRQLLVVQDMSLVSIHPSPTHLTIPYCHNLTQLQLQPTHSQFLGWLANIPCYGAVLSDLDSAPPSSQLISLRQLYGELNSNLFAVAGRASQIMDWHRTHQFCSVCATPLIQPASRPSKQCPQCQQRYYPKLSPAIIVRVVRGEEILLARSPRFRPGMYSVLAGFVEPGESLEETIAREIREEVGIEVKNICYFGSRPWPFPNSLMLAFTADYAAGELTPEPSEIEDVAWFTKGKLPEIPSSLSIANMLINDFLASVK